KLGDDVDQQQPVPRDEILEPDLQSVGLQLLEQVVSSDLVARKRVVPRTEPGVVELANRHQVSDGSLDPAGIDLVNELAGPVDVEWLAIAPRRNRFWRRRHQLVHLVAS